MTGLAERDLAHIWHPCSQMKDYETFPPIEVVAAKGSYLTTASGHTLIDAISSWWCKSLGHQHPRLQAALRQQLDRLEHVILANTTNQTIVSLSEKLARLSPTLDKVMYASDGSCAVEIAMKMSLHAQQLRGATKRREFMALTNSYHGETLLALAASDAGVDTKPYQHILPKVNFLRELPYVSGPSDPLWHDCSSMWPAIAAQLEIHCATLAAIIVEPIVQGAAGMRIYSPDLLRRLRHFTNQHQIYLIADEIMTGFGRTGFALACQHAGIEPDFLCLAKGMTAGMLPMSAMLTSSTIYQLFYDDYATGKAFLHSHTHSGNVLAAAVAVEVQLILEQEGIYQRVQEHSHLLAEALHDVAIETKKLCNIRAVGWLAAADLITDHPRGGYHVYRSAIEGGALLRPLGNTIYWLPPLNTDLATITSLRDITARAITRCSII